MNKTKPTYYIQIKGSDEWQQVSFKFIADLQLLYKDRLVCEHNENKRTSHYTLTQPPAINASFENLFTAINGHFDLIDNVINNYTGDARVLESAIGCYLFGLMYGWKVLYLIHSKATLRRYQQILGFKFRELVPEIGELAHKSEAYQTMLDRNTSSFWKYVNQKGITSPKIN